MYHNCIICRYTKIYYIIMCYSRVNAIYNRNTRIHKFGKPASSMKPLKSGNQGILNVVQRSMEAPMSWRPVDKPLFTMCAVSLLIHVSIE